MLNAWVAEVGRESDCRSRGRKFESQLGHITFVEIDHGIISMVILPILLIQEGHLSISCVTTLKKCWVTAQRIKCAQEKCG